MSDVRWMSKKYLDYDRSFWDNFSAIISIEMRFSLCESEKEMLHSEYNIDKYRLLFLSQFDTWKSKVCFRKTDVN